jgi:hypothetical protein
LWYVEGSLTDIHRELRSEFDDLWDIISNDDRETFAEVKDKHKGGMKKKKMMTDKELP